jgi:hypothetical protein
MLTKILTSTFTMLFAFVGAVVSAYAFLMNDIKASNEATKSTLRIERSAMIGELRQEISGVRTEITGVKVLVQSVDGKVDILLSK